MSPRFLITAFEPYDRWPENASWLALVEYTKSMTSARNVTTRLYPVDFNKVKQRLEEDLTGDFDIAVHLGQAPGSSRIHLEAVGLNIGGNSKRPIESHEALVEDGPVAYRSELPLGECARTLRDAGIPARLSFHAGTFLCNAILYLTHYIAEQRGFKTRAAFMHLPLADSQAARESNEVPSMAPATAAKALDILLATLATRTQPRELA